MCDKSFCSLVRHAPLGVYLAVYVTTCLLAAIPFCFGYAPFLILLDYFSGVAIPTSFSSSQWTAFLALLVGAPALFTFGYLAAMRIDMRNSFALRRSWDSDSDHPVPDWFPFLVFSIAAIIGGYDLARAGAFGQIGVWSDYGQWVQARWALYSTLHYLNFVNLYSIIPISAAWVMLSVKGTGLKQRAVRFVTLVIVLVLTFPLFQKKALLAALIIIFGAMLMHRALSEHWGKRLTWLLLSASGLLVSVYFLLVVLPVYSETSNTADQILISEEQLHRGGKDIKELEDVNRRRAAAIASVLGPDRDVHLLAYAFLAPLTRTAAPAMYYPIVFPEKHDFYPFDVGQDILGWGNMPDDNRVVWRHMYPDLPGGAVAAPYQFVLYSQVDVGGTLLLCAMVGALLGALWRGILFCKADPSWRSLNGSILLLFSIYLAIDSVRGSLLSSYGVIWPWLFVTLTFTVGRMLKTGLRPDNTI